MLHLCERRTAPAPSTKIIAGSRFAALLHPSTSRPVIFPFRDPDPPVPAVLCLLSSTHCLLPTCSAVYRLLYTTRLDSRLRNDLRREQHPQQREVASHDQCSPVEPIASLSTKAARLSGCVCVSACVVCPGGCVECARACVLPHLTPHPPLLPGPLTATTPLGTLSVSLCVCQIKEIQRDLVRCEAASSRQRQRRSEEADLTPEHLNT